MSWCEIWHLFSRAPLSWCYYRKLITSIALEKCKNECDLVEIILVQGFFPLKIEITQFPDGLRLNFVSRQSQCLPRRSRRKQNELFAEETVFKWFVIYSPRRKKRFRLQINGSRERSTFAGNSALLPSYVIDFAMSPTQRFWRETVTLLGVMCPRRNQWERAVGKKIPAL